MTENQSENTGQQAGARSFFDDLQRELSQHPALCHPFLRRFSEADLKREQLVTFSIQHYMYSRFFIRNLAAVISQTPDEHARSLLILNIYEEIGEPLRLRDRVHLLLLEAGVVTPSEVGSACMEVVQGGNRGDIVQILMNRGLISREQISQVVERNQRSLTELTHPALFRRYLGALGIKPAEIDSFQPIYETTRVVEEYSQLCRHGHWLESLGAMGPGTECVVPTFYYFLHEGIRRSGILEPADYIFWTIHIHCDEGHGKNIIDALCPYAETAENRARIRYGALRVLDARAAWFSGLERLLFG